VIAVTMKILAAAFAVVLLLRCCIAEIQRRSADGNLQGPQPSPPDATPAQM